jgi:hypothetical protein
MIPEKIIDNSDIKLSAFLNDVFNRSAHLLPCNNLLINRYHLPDCLFF